MKFLLLLIGVLSFSLWAIPETPDRQQLEQSIVQKKNRRALTFGFGLFAEKTQLSPGIRSGLSFPLSRNIPVSLTASIGGYMNQAGGAHILCPALIGAEYVIAPFRRWSFPMALEMGAIIDRKIFLTVMGRVAVAARIERGSTLQLATEVGVVDQRTVFIPQIILHNDF